MTSPMNFITVFILLVNILIVIVPAFMIVNGRNKIMENKESVGDVFCAHGGPWLSFRKKLPLIALLVFFLFGLNYSANKIELYVSGQSSINYLSISLFMIILMCAMCFGTATVVLAHRYDYIKFSKNRLTLCIENKITDILIVDILSVQQNSRYRVIQLKNKATYKIYLNQFANPQLLADKLDRIKQCLLNNPSENLRGQTPFEDKDKEVQ